MRAARFTGGMKVCLEEVRTPEPGPGEVRVRVKYCGLCGSERPQYLSGYHHHQGHEVVGEVEKPGPGVLSVNRGDRVAIYLTAYCGRCAFCRQGLTNLCSVYSHKMNLGWAVPGGFAEFVVVPENQLMHLREGVSFEAGVLLLDTLGTPFHGLRLAEPIRAGRPLTKACVIGCGTVGQGSIVILQALGAEQILAVDRSPSRLAQAESLGAVAVPAAPGALESIAAEGFDLVVEAVGLPGTLAQGIRAVRPLGTVLGLGELPERFEIEYDLAMRLKDFFYIRSWYFPLKEFSENQELWLSGFFSGAGSLITHILPAERMQEGADLFYGGQSGKVLIEF